MSSKARLERSLLFPHSTYCTTIHESNSRRFLIELPQSLTWKKDDRLPLAVFFKFWIGNEIWLLRLFFPWHLQQQVWFWPSMVNKHWFYWNGPSHKSLLLVPRSLYMHSSFLGRSHSEGYCSYCYGGVILVSKRGKYKKFARALFWIFFLCSSVAQSSGHYSLSQNRNAESATWCG